MLVLFGSETYAKRHSAITLFILFLTPPVLFPGTARRVGEGKSKYKTLGMPPGYHTDKQISPESLAQLKQLLEACGLPMEDR